MSLPSHSHSPYQPPLLTAFEALLSLLRATAAKVPHCLHHGSARLKNGYLDERVRWQPDQRVKLFRTKTAVIVNERPREPGAAQRGNVSAAHRLHEQKCELMHELFTTSFVGVDVRGLQFLPGQKKYHFLQYFGGLRQQRFGTEGPLSSVARSRRRTRRRTRRRVRSLLNTERAAALKHSASPNSKSLVSVIRSMKMGYRPGSGRSSRWWKTWRK